MALCAGHTAPAPHGRTVPVRHRGRVPARRARAADDDRRELAPRHGARSTPPFAGHGSWSISRFVGWQIGCTKLRLRWTYFTHLFVPQERLLQDIQDDHERRAVGPAAAAALDAYEADQAHEVRRAAWDTPADRRVQAILRAAHPHGNPYTAADPEHCPYFGHPLLPRFRLMCERRGPASGRMLS